MKDEVNVLYVSKMVARIDLSLDATSVNGIYIQ